MPKIFTVLHTTCCGIDVHKKSVTVCLLKTDEHGEFTDTIRTFSTMTSDLEQLKVWLKTEGCQKVAMESTGVYWVPVYNVLEDTFEIILANAHQVKNLPGKKTDPNDSRWSSKLLALGLISGSFIPPKDQRELRELTRYRDKLISMRTSEKDRAHNILELCNIKLASVASNIFGVSGMAMLNALIKNKEDADPLELAELAKGTMRKKIPELVKALQGRVDAHHADTLSMILDHLAYLDQQIAKLEQRIEEKAKAFQQEIDLLNTIPGINKTAAQSIIAEIGIDMSVFETPERLVSWAGLCPGCNETGGKKKVLELDQVINI